jgi:hypothetical protein
MAISTYGVTLKWGLTMATATKEIDIKDFPDLGGAPEMLETTTFNDDSQTYIKGIQSLGALEFTANYTKTDYNKVAEDNNIDLFYILEFGSNGSEGAFYWKGKHTAYVVGAGVNAVTEMKIAIAPSTKPTVRPNLTTVTLGDLTDSVESSPLDVEYSGIPAETPILTYQWKISETEDGTYSNIQEANSPTYTPVEGDVGKYIKVQVTSAGGATGVVLSNAVVVAIMEGLNDG